MTGVELTPQLIRGYLLKVMELGKPYTTAELWPMVDEQHSSLGGKLAAVRDPQGRISKCLSELKREGLVDDPVRGQWQRHPGAGLPVEKELEDKAEAEVEIGDGAETVYGWYLPAYRKLANFERGRHFPVKVGRTARAAAADRIEDHMGTVPEIYKLGFKFRTDRSSVWEQFLHAHLKLHGRHIADAVGMEWFSTSPQELRTIVETKLREIGGADGGEKETEAGDHLELVRTDDGVPDRGRRDPVP